MANMQAPAQIPLLYRDLVLREDEASDGESDSRILKTDRRSGMPRMMYGTAWKMEQTADLVYKAIKAGFRALDTAAQPKHYNEAGVGEGVRRAIREGIARRQDLWIQSKFTSASGQRGQAPYDPTSPLKTQVETSILGSLVCFRVEEDREPYLDSLVLHAPYKDDASNAQVWSCFEEFVPDKIRYLGISNLLGDSGVLETLLQQSRVKPAIIQNRFHAPTKYEVELRERWCTDDQGAIIFQSFWTLSANPDMLASTAVEEVAQGARVTKTAAFYCLVMGLGKICVLNGTTRERHMREDLEGWELVSTWADGEGKAAWERSLRAFKSIIGQAD
ncbi:NADP-dependent oxidoreductase domain-containing protein [Emericellopsis atlantica]|uniref:NADP-dependent oxidoreductase domain-containing protein n=1 Tax=Emericellopsis atlantica TaxID=2614577 RepID=A0A9P7ZTD5_9HYPO|nr:NADP-dependent oxidoreductase domain-containing protein [Emericellopsis atlantica]KAG9257452.1 NADP-dependent oxidoreductase domain-containing protein [Emericellopsis atlantica]